MATPVRPTVTRKPCNERPSLVGFCPSCNGTAAKLRPLACDTHYKCMNCIMKVGFDCECQRYSAAVAAPIVSQKVHVFMDNSNIWIEAKKLGGKVEDKRVRIDAGHLLKIVAKGREIGGAILYGSEPPPLDTVWKEMHRKGWEVKTLERSQCTDREKLIDTQIVADMDKLVYKNSPNNNVIILISGDADMIPGINAAIAEKWKVEIYTWEHAMSLKLPKIEEEQVNNCSIHFLDAYQNQILFNSMKFPIAKNKKLLAIVRTNGIVCKIIPNAFKHNKGNPTSEWCNGVEKKFREKFRFFFWIEELDAETQLTVNSNLLVLVFTEIEPNSFKIAHILETQKQSISIPHVLEMETYLNYERKPNATSPQLKLTNQFSWLDCTRNLEDDEILEQLGLVDLQTSEESSSPSPIPLSPVYHDDPIIETDYHSFEEMVSEEEEKKEEEKKEEGWTTVKCKRKTTKKPKQLYSQSCKNGQDCSEGLNCSYKHTEKEKAAFQKNVEQSKPQNYKTRQCNRPRCFKADKCNFAHGEDDAICYKCKEKGHFSINCNKKKL